MAEAVQVPSTVPAETAADNKAPPAPTPDYRPDWISATQWIKLPAMLRAALIGSTVINGVIQAISPQLANLIATRYGSEVAALGVGAPSKVCYTPDIPASRLLPERHQDTSAAPALIEQHVSAPASLEESAIASIA